MTPKMQRRAAKFGSPFGRPAQPTSSEQPSVGTLDSVIEASLSEIEPVSNETSQASVPVSKPEIDGTEGNPRLWMPSFTVKNMTCCGFMDVAGIHGVIRTEKKFFQMDGRGDITWYRHATPDEYFQELHRAIEKHDAALQKANTEYNETQNKLYRKQTTQEAYRNAQHAYNNAMQFRTRVTGAYLFTYTIEPDVFRKEIDEFLKETGIGVATHAPPFRNGNSGHNVYTTVVSLNTGPSGAYQKWARAHKLNMDIVR
jgi:hypothetical protein